MLQHIWGPAYAAETQYLRVFVGQLRTSLAIPGQETEGPQRAAQALLAAVAGSTKGEPRP